MHGKNSMEKILFSHIGSKSHTVTRWMGKYTEIPFPFQSLDTTAVRYIVPNATTVSAAVVSQNCFVIHELCSHL